MDGEEPTVGERRGSTLYLAGGGFRASIFHLGALTRLNELGLLAGTETIHAVAGGSIVAALIAARIPWPLHGAFRDWPETVAEPLRAIAQSRVRPWALPRAWPGGAEAAREERFARELADPDEDGEDGRPRLVIGAAGLALGQLEEGSREEGASLRWELGGPAGLPGYDPELIAEALERIGVGLNPLGEAAQGVLENHGYLLVDHALRDTRRRVAALEPQPPEPPHPALMSPGSVRDSLLAAARRPRIGPMRGGWARRGRRRRHPDIDGLLERYRPILQYDSLESFRADSVAMIAEMAIEERGSVLSRADGTAIASVLPAAGASRLHLGYLDRHTYADGLTVEPGDYLDAAGGSHAADARALRRHPGYGDVVYGHAVEAGGMLWLQYWLFFYFNDKGFLNAGRHQGDWEMIQVRIDDREEPDAVVFAQHAGAERAAWREVEREPTGSGSAAPIVYCARGSHAPRLRRGTHPAPGAPDHNDGLGPRLRPRLVRIGPGGPGWAQWPGRWGSTRRREAFEGNSPHGPVEHLQWRDPETLHREARPLAETPAWEEPPPATPRYGARRGGEAAVLSYRFPDHRGGRAAPAKMVAAPLGEDPGDIVIAHSFLIDGPGGSCVMPVPADEPLRGIRASVSSELGTPGETVTVPIDD